MTPQARAVAPVAVFIVVLAAVLAPPAVSASEENRFHWRADLLSATAEATATGKPILAVFT